MGIVIQRRIRAIVILLICSAPLLASGVAADQVPVRYTEGVMRGFMRLRAQDGTQIADGETTQTATDGKVTSHLMFRFKDGSTYDDTTTFTQNGSFRLLKDHVIQKGAAFKLEMESTIDATTGRVIVHYNKEGHTGDLDRTMDLPPDLANGMIFTIVKNIPQNTVTTVSYLGLTPKPRLVKLAFTPGGEERVRTGALHHEALRYIMKVEIGGVTGVVASILRKHPPDTQIWVIDDGTPSFAGSEGPLYGEGPIWKVELVSPRGIVQATTASH